MRTACDRYWWAVNRNSILLYTCCIPLAVIFPLGGFILPMVFLHSTCCSYLTFDGSNALQEDGLRFIMTMPFSRETIFKTYSRGLAALSLGYAAVIGLIRSLMLLMNCPVGLLWLDNIGTVGELFRYMLALTAELLLLDLILIWSVNRFTETNSSTYALLCCFAMPAVIGVLLFFRDVLGLIVGMSMMKMNTEYDGGELLKIDSVPVAAKGYVFFSIFLVVLLLVLTLVVREDARKKFVRRPVYVWW